VQLPKWFNYPSSILILIMKNLPRTRTRFKNRLELKQGEFVDYETGRKSTPQFTKVHVLTPEPKPESNSTTSLRLRFKVCG
jgi:hypothetical protein